MKPLFGYGSTASDGCGLLSSDKVVPDPNNTGDITSHTILQDVASGSNAYSWTGSLWAPSSVTPTADSAVLHYGHTTICTGDGGADIAERGFPFLRYVGAALANPVRLRVTAQFGASETTGSGKGIYTPINAAPYDAISKPYTLLPSFGDDGNFALPATAGTSGVSEDFGDYANAEILQRLRFLYAYTATRDVDLGAPYILHIMSITKIEVLCDGAASPFWTDFLGTADVAP